MARTSRPSTSKSKGTRTPDARAKANAAGYLARRSKKAPTARLEDVYELVENEDNRRSKRKGKKPRRETVELEYDYGEDGAEGDRRGGSDEEDEEGQAPRLLGEGDTIESGDDEEIDSDAAFEDVDGDAEGFAGVFGRKKALTKKKKPRTVRFADVDLDENEDADVAMKDSDADSDAEEEEEDLDSDTYIDILDVLDGKGEVYNEDSDGEHARPPIPLRDAAPARREEDVNSDAGEDQEDDESASANDSDDEEVDSDNEADDIDTSPAALTALHDLIAGLPSAAPPPASAKRKAPADDAPRKKRALAERTHAGAEGEFHVGAGAGGIKLALADLLAPLATALPGVQKSLAPTTKPAPTGKKADASTGKKTKAKERGALAAPLPLRTQARVDREAAYEATKAEVDKWNPSMKRMREAEHLSFPLQAPAVQGRPSSAALVASFTPRTELETGVARLLAAAHLSHDADVLRTENTLLAATLDPAEVARRRAELRLQRELAFRGEVKARRVARIKSRVYRKIARGRKAREGGGAEGEGAEDDEEGRMRREVERARERAGMRVKRKAGWRPRGEDEEGEEEEEDGTVLGGRHAMEAELERKERLTRLIRGEGDDEADSSGSDDDADADEGAVKRAAFEELRALQDDEEGDGGEAPQKGVFGMKFMRDGMARRAAEAGHLADDFVAEMGLAVGGGSDEEGGESGGEGGKGVVVQRTGGRVAYRPGEAAAAASTSKVPDESPATRSTSPPPASAPARPRPLLAAAVSAADPNPWLTQAASSTGPKAPRAKNDVVVSKDSTIADKTRHRLAKDAKKRDAGAVAAVRDDGVVEIEMGKVLGDEQGSGDDEDANSEVDAQEAALSRKKRGKGKAGAGPKAFEQRDLVALAFAGDNVVRDFEDAKRREIASDAPRVVDTTLPGWGAWGGPETHKGGSKPKPKAHLLKQIPGIAPAARADHGKAHVIISEKRDRKAAKYQVADLPYPFTSRAQYERSMEAPLGAEWNTRVGFQRGTLPRVVKKMGMVIEPLTKLS